MTAHATTRAVTDRPRLDRSSRPRPRHDHPAGPPVDSIDPAAADALGRDTAALLWDLTVRRLHQAFGQAVPELSEQVDSVRHDEGGGQIARKSAAARVRLAATRYAMTEIRYALGRIAADTYDLCAGCGAPIDPARRQTLPATRWCTTCQDASSPPPALTGHRAVAGFDDDAWP